MQELNDYVLHDQIDIRKLSQYIPMLVDVLLFEDYQKNVSKEEILSAFRSRFLQSKAWLIDKLNNLGLDRNTKILVVGGWLGFTSLALNNEGYKNITEIDLNNDYEKITRRLNKFNDSFQYINSDVNDLDCNSFDVIINCSCEHIIDNRWFDNAGLTPLFILQSNNIPDKDHVNLSNSLPDMKSKYPLRLKYAGEMNFKNGTSRYMLIGKKF